MKILIVSPFPPFPESLNGVNKINVHLLAENPYFKADALCLGALPASIPAHATGTAARIVAIPAADRRYPGRNVIRWLCGSYPFNVAKLRPHWKRLAAELNQLGPGYDVIHLSTPSLVPLLDHLPDALRRKTLLFPIDSMTLYTERRLASETSPGIKLALAIDLAKIRRFERHYYRKPAKAVFVSDRDCLAVASLAQDCDLAHIPNGVDTDYFKPAGDKVEGTPVVLFTGVMSYAPNRWAALFLARRVMPLLRRELPGVRLCLAGREPDAELLALDGGDIRVTGYVEDIRPFLASASLYLSPLSFGSGIKNKVLEAMAMGIPVLGSPLSFEGIDGEAGTHFLTQDGQDAARWATAVAATLRKPDLLRETGHSARELVERSYSWDAIRRRYGEVYESRINHR